MYVDAIVHTNECRPRHRFDACMCPELGKLLYESNILHITSYFYQEVANILKLHITPSKK